MKKLLIVPLLCLSLGGCASLQAIGTAFQLGTASATNPVTKDRLYEIETTISLVFSGLNAWKKTCVQGLINATCKDQIAAVQVYTRQIPPYLRQLRVFVKTNDQVNASVVFNTLTTLVTTVRTQAAQSGQSL